MKKSIRNLNNIEGKKALVRVDINVPLDDNRNVTDDTRIRAIIPTIKMLQEKGAKIILVAHLGRPKGERKPEFSLDTASKRLSEVLGQEVLFLNDSIGDEVKAAIAGMKNGDVALLENIRFYKEETDNDEAFAKELASLADFYVNDAFGAAHRAHASTEGVAKLLSPAVSGLLMEKELNALGGLLQNPKRPFTAIVGGAKVSTKIAVLENLIDKVDNLIIGGGMTYTFVAAQGYSVGNSICEPDMKDIANKIVEKAKAKGVKLYLTKDVVVCDEFSENANTKVVDATAIPDGWEGVDAGPETRKMFAEVIKNSKTILWNGPVGAFEIDKFTEGTKAVAEAVCEATKAGAVSVLGGGDTVAAAKKYKFGNDCFSHISTGGGASLEFIEGKILPGVAALDD